MNLGEHVRIQVLFLARQGVKIPRLATEISPISTQVFQIKRKPPFFKMFGAEGC